MGVRHLFPVTRAWVERRDAAIRAEEYERIAWANRLAKRGYVVLCHDGFLFASRKVRLADVSPRIRWNSAKDVSDGEPPEEIRAYNEWAGQHEHVMAPRRQSSRQRHFPHSHDSTWPESKAGDNYDAQRWSTRSK